ncbi:MAG: extracellular solute-binding protein [Bifidobacterium scardovii]|uniref:ABC transporter substrate-binding protein n=1 Tax=Bifidobacterium scardovii TaxID=158787 RepID=UPI002900007F|nr:extracellular solute-binding protein [Bifidobacterium scardovii]MDU2421989.1 extracellular solute-binding protein [Bifidobacterium scardovii]
MKSTRRVISVSLAVAAMIGMAGCGGGTAQEEHPTSIKIWHYEEATTAQAKAWDKAISIFEKETGVKVDFEKKAFEQIRQNASQILNSDDAPDVMEYNKGNATAGLLASQGLLTNLNDYVSKYGWDKIVTGSLADTGKYDERGVMGSGDWYGITNYGEDCLLYFNEDMFKKYGIAIPTTFDELENAMAKFKENGVTAFSAGSAEYPTQHLWWQLVLSKADDKFIKAYEMYDGKVKAEDAGQNFMTGVNPIFFSGTWWHARFKGEAAGLHVAYAKFPDTKKIVGSSGNIWVIPEKSAKKDLAAKFINITLSDEVQNYMAEQGGLAIHADTNSIKDEETKQFVAQFDEAVKENQLGFYPDWPTSTFYDEINASLQELINGTADVKKVLGQMKENYDKGLEASGITAK